MTLFEDINIAHQRIESVVRRTPLEKSEGLSSITQAEVFLKCEHLQRTGSFKFRGAANKILSLSDTERGRGVIAASSGNHGIGVSLAAQLTKTKATIFTPNDASPVKLNTIQKLGGVLRQTTGDCLISELAAREFSATEKMTYISPYNDATVIAGQGTIGLEMYQQVPDLDAVFVAVGGGGLISGIGGYLKAQNPAIEVIGCWPQNSAAMHESIKAGKIVTTAETPTISDGTAGQLEPEAITLPLCQQLIDKHVLVSEDEIRSAMQDLAAHDHWIVEGAAGVALAGFLKTAEKYRHRKVGVVLCGRNIELDVFRKVIL